jgi:hypothetical protein
MLNKTPISRLYAYARECVGRAIYREKWISSLTDDERDLIAELRPVNASSIIPGMITYMSTEGGRWHSSNPAFDAEIKRALRRQKRMRGQHAQVELWLKSRGFHPNVTFSTEAFHRKFKRSFPNAIGIADFRPNGAELRRSPVEQATLIPAPDASPAPQLPTVEPDAVKPHIATGKRKRRSSKLDAAMDALHALFPNGYYSGLTASVVLGPVTKWLEEKRPGVRLSEDRLQTALKKFEAQTKNS